VDAAHAGAALGRRIHEAAAAVGRPIRIMEVCGTHTVSLRRHGIHSLLPPSVTMLSGPGCPVCVTPSSYVDNALALVERHGAIVATFGDMLRVPGSDGRTLARHLGTRGVRIVYSPADLQALAAEEGSRPVVFLGVGFETTAPTIAATFARVADEGPRSLYLYSALKTIPRALEALLEDPALGIDGFLLPGHVSAVIGARAYDFLPRAKRPLPAAIAGFEPLEMLAAILTILELVRDGTPEVRNVYRRVVRDEGNPHALAAMARVLEPATEPWRGMGELPGAALALRPEYAAVDAARVFGLATAALPDPPGCRCAEVVRGVCAPPACPLFGRSCTPDRPVGPCMVSSEGTCAAHFRYGTEGA
jgi:hydrogenase expression/formation protein HypD